VVLMPAALVPELLVGDLAASVDFWCVLIGFRVRHDRPEEGFAYLELAQPDGGFAEVMLEQRNPAARQWITGTLDRPLGRGINFEIAHPDLEATLLRLAAAAWPLYLPPEEKWYRAGDCALGQRQFLVQDPDGYLLRLAQDIGKRSWVTPAA
jgi:catechol 2,3-dioxygenase-like lactoylglutathione lyase family enzyme